MIFFIYLIRNTLNNKVYVGFTSANPIIKRWQQHKKVARGLGNGSVYYKKVAYYIHYAINKHGIDNFVFSVITTCTSLQDAAHLEKFWIKFFNSADKNYGYNETLGGEGNIPTEITREKKRQKMIENRDNGKNPLPTNLTRSNVLEIKKLLIEGKYSQKEIAGMYNTSPQSVGLIGKNKIFCDVLKDTPIIAKDGDFKPPGYLHRAGVKNSQAKFNEQDIIDIKESHKNGARVNDIAKKYNAHRSTISAIVNGWTY